MASPVTIAARPAAPSAGHERAEQIAERVAALFDRSHRAQARLLVEQAAHPDARPWLRESAARMGLAPSPAAANVG